MESMVDSKGLKGDFLKKVMFVDGVWCICGWWIDIFLVKIEVRNEIKCIGF